MKKCRSKEITPAYNAARIKQFAVTGGPESKMMGFEEQTLPGEDVVTKVCKTPEELLDWLSST